MFQYIFTNKQTNISLKGVTHVEDTNEDVREFVVISEPMAVSVQDHVIKAAELIRHFLPLPAAPSCSTSGLSKAEDLLSASHLGKVKPILILASSLSDVQAVLSNNLVCWRDSVRLLSPECFLVDSALSLYKHEGSSQGGTGLHGRQGQLPKQRTEKHGLLT